MNLHWILFLLLSTSLSAEMITGVIEKLGPDQFQLKTTAGIITIATDPHTKIRKSAVQHTAAALALGDEIRVSYYGEQASKMVAVNISASVTLRGVVTGSNPTRITLRNKYAMGGAAPDCEDIIFVFLHPDTKLGTGRGQLAVGREIQVKGWDVSDGVVDAVGIAIYNSDVPVRLPRKS